MNPFLVLHLDRQRCFVVRVQESYVVASRRTGYTRVIVEKPFGKDSDSFRKLSADLYQHLTEDQMYRIDHYLGKELIENLTVSFSLLNPAACHSVSQKHSASHAFCQEVLGEYAWGQAVSLHGCRHVILTALLQTATGSVHP